jgi:hypothetical protein
MHRPRLIVIAAVLAGLLGSAGPAAADITGFLGFSPTTATRGARGVAVGSGFLVVAFEFEYSSISQELSSGAPGLTSGMFNVLLQTPIPVAGMQFYGTVGGGIYKEELGVVSETSFGTNLGGGVKLRLIGPLRARFDYRLFKLQGSPINTRYNRFYAGLNVRF